MKKNILWVLAAIMSMGILASCSDDDDDYYVYTLNLQKDTQIKYTDKGVWDKAYTTDDLYVDPFSFNHKGYDSYGGYFSGYVAAKTTDSGYFDDMLAHQFDVIAGGGAKGVGSPYGHLPAQGSWRRKSLHAYVGEDLQYLLHLLLHDTRQQLLPQV